MPYKRIISNLLHVNNLRKFLGNVSVSLAVKSKFKLEILDRPPPGRVLVLAPHPDDDVFGCGGTLALHQKNSDPIKVIYLTASPERRKEIMGANKLLRITDIEFWGLIEGKFTATKQIIKKMAAVIKQYQPTIIYSPNFTDPHPDHFEAAKILYLSLSNPGLSERSLNSVSMLLYEIWTPLYANRLIKIDSVIERKKAAMSCHKSQLKDRHYQEAILGLNAYRAGMFSAGRYTEAFTALNPDLYAKLFKIYNLK